MRDIERTGKIILDLCGGTGSWSRPWALNGYDVRIITLPDHDVRTYEPPDGVYGILAAPPCTEFSVLNCVAENRCRDFESGMEIVNACLRIIEKCKPVWWAMENPRGYLRQYIGNPKLTFQPWEYGDTVYINTPSGATLSEVVDSITKPQFRTKTLDGLRGLDFEFCDYGKTVFLSHKEAERALEGIK